MQPLLFAEFFFISRKDISTDKKSYSQLSLYKVKLLAMNKHLYVLTTIGTNELPATIELKVSVRRLADTVHKYNFYSDQN